MMHMPFVYIRNKQNEKQTSMKLLIITVKKSLKKTEKSRRKIEILIRTN